MIRQIEFDTHALEHLLGKLVLKDKEKAILHSNGESVPPFCRTLSISAEDWLLDDSIVCLQRQGK